MSAHRCCTAWNEPIGLSNCTPLLGVLDRELERARCAAPTPSTTYATASRSSVRGDRVGRVTRAEPPARAPRSVTVASLRLPSTVGVGVDRHARVVALRPRTRRARRRDRARSRGRGWPRRRRRRAPSRRRAATRRRRADRRVAAPRHSVARAGSKSASVPIVDPSARPGSRNVVLARPRRRRARATPHRSPTTRTGAGHSARARAPRARPRRRPSPCPRRRAPRARAGRSRRCRARPAHTSSWPSVGRVGLVAPRARSVIGALSARKRAHGLAQHLLVGTELEVHDGAPDATRARGSRAIWLTRTSGNYPAPRCDCSTHPKTRPSAPSWSRGSRRHQPSDEQFREPKHSSAHMPEWARDVAARAVRRGVARARAGRRSSAGATRRRRSR